MAESAVERRRRRVGYVLLGLPVLVAGYFFCPEIPILFGPSASASVKAEGRELFLHTWTPGDELAGGDGLGPVFNERSCVACHFQGGVGGGGELRHNVTAYDVLPTPTNTDPQGGVVHAFAVRRELHETIDLVKKLYPVVKGATKVEFGCTIQLEDFDPVNIETINTPTLFGAGWIDRISGRAIAQNRVKRTLANAVREFDLKFDHIGPGRAHVLPDGRVGKFGWKAQFATLEEFVAAACANELGLGNPLMNQATPLGNVAYASPGADLDRKQFRALVAFCDTLPRPVELVSEDEMEQARAARGKEVFHGIGCAVCHVPDLGGVKGVYSDFLLHDLETPRPSGSGYTQPLPELPIPENHPKRQEWKTPPLWACADTAPYFHDGKSATLESAIVRHNGDAAVVSEAYGKLQLEDKRALVSFLKTLKSPPDAEPAPSPGRLAGR